MGRFRSVVVLTGAGISAESGIRTFRANDGLWENHRVEDVATPAAFARDPALVHRFYNARRQHLLGDIQPNAGHRALAEFERAFPGNFTLITQNIDNLHQRAGSQNVLAMHGELLKVRCAASGRLYPCREDIDSARACPCCNRPGLLRPHVVWFGEMPLFMQEIEAALSNCDLFVAIGTSGNVYPAAGFFQLASACGAHTVELNLEPSLSGSQFDRQDYGPATEVVPAFFASLP
ncbi:NAD-dependent protein deacylase [Exilibacterium tricleocarpae]|uniref:NAD-dependent protein deacylase n=1 Tax=Exilibacterium tricleocarpae TaxID=2591008 RepID=A0A545SS74_9GAMM|nr:Sir2 family NAD+-dependent deacetylase [Exilibacterium tricleocarpae]TQV67766.1 NAD-dependent protein deacylase [Exilibacterium tricleocarpae]